MTKRSGLGRGLDALIDTSSVNTSGSSSINEVELSKIQANPLQPRHTFDEEALEELAISIRELGVISPITLRKNEDDTYLIIAGERRFRAAKKAGLTTIPAYIRTAKDEQVMEMALIENIQREDLDAIEIALAYQRLMDDYQLTQERMSERVGKKRATIANYLRLLKLPAEIQMGIKEKKIDMGHARAILGVKQPTTQLDIYKKILKDGLSVRRVEELASREREAQEAAERGETVDTKEPKQLQPEMQAVETHLARYFDKKVTLVCNTKGRGKITINFRNQQELQDVLSKLRLEN